MIKFADDITLSSPINDMTDSSIVLCEIDGLKNWADNNMMKLNIKKRGS